MFEVSVELTFAAGHALRGYKGKCENVHGHNYRVAVKVEGERLNSIGLLVDFVEIKRILRNAIEYLDHRFLNDLPPFTELNPTAENMARYFYEEMVKGLAAGSAEVPARVREVVVWETDTSAAAYRPS
jgi:6-pyruvoyltetrahydropterin/6-carboxytetrahydropterin synthase